MLFYKKGALGFVQKAKGTADYMAAVNDVRSEKYECKMSYEAEYPSEDIETESIFIRKEDKREDE